MVEFADSFYKSTVDCFILAILADFVKSLDVQHHFTLAILVNFLKWLSSCVAKRKFLLIFYLNW